METEQDNISLSCIFIIFFFFSNNNIGLGRSSVEHTYDPS